MAVVGVAEVVAVIFLELTVVEDAAVEETDAEEADVDAPGLALVVLPSLAIQTPAPVRQQLFPESPAPQQ